MSRSHREAEQAPRDSASFLGQIPSLGLSGNAFLTCEDERRRTHFRLAPPVILYLVTVHVKVKVSMLLK